MTLWQFALSGQMWFGRGCSAEVGRWLALRLRPERVLLVTDSQLLRLGLAGPVTDGLRQAGISWTAFEGGQPEPSVQVAEHALRQAIEDRPEVVIGLGGGSNLDVAKLVAACLSNGGRPADYFGFDRLAQPSLPMIAIPTTAGTGSEVSHSAVLTDHERGVKVSTLSPYLRPTLAVVDPELTDSCPPSVTAASGIDALVHAVEATLARPNEQLVAGDPLQRAYHGRHPLADILAEQAIRRVASFLPRAVADGSDRLARDEMALAATLAGAAFSNAGVAVVHALEYPIGALVHCSHGEGNGLLLPHVMRYNAPACQARMERLADWLEPSSESVGRSLSESLSHSLPRSSAGMTAAERAVGAVERLLDQIGIRRQLRQLGLQRESIPQVAAAAHAIERLMQTNPRYPTVDDLVAILEAAY
jgi:alcohol dehydrogenase class IV